MEGESLVHRVWAYCVLDTPLWSLMCVRIIESWWFCELFQLVVAWFVSIKWHSITLGLGLCTALLVVSGACWNNSLSECMVAVELYPTTGKHLIPDRWSMCAAGFSLFLSLPLSSLPLFPCLPLPPFPSPSLFLILMLHVCVQAYISCANLIYMYMCHICAHIADVYGLIWIKQLKVTSVTPTKLQLELMWVQLDAISLYAHLTSVHIRPWVSIDTFHGVTLQSEWMISTCTCTCMSITHVHVCLSYHMLSLCVLCLWIWWVIGRERGKKGVRERVREWVM